MSAIILINKVNIAKEENVWSDIAISIDMFKTIEISR